MPPRRHGRLSGGEPDLDPTVALARLEHGLPRRRRALFDRTVAKVATASLTGLDVATNSLTGSDISEASLSVSGMGCQIGVVQAFARVKGAANMPSTYTSDFEWSDTRYNCAGGSVQVCRADQGVYFVRFNGLGSRLALAISNSDGFGVEGRGILSGRCRRRTLRSCGGCGKRGNGRSHRVAWADERRLGISRPRAD